MARDYYQVLEVGRDATTEEIKKSFRKIARVTHPDANPDDPEAEARFREAAEAYEVLSDPDRRARYDRGDKVDLSDLFGGFGGFDDLLRSVFGEGGLFGGGGGGRPRRGRDILIRTEISLSEAAFGTDSAVEYRSAATCPECSGSGSAPGTLPEMCPECGGSGQTRIERRSMFGTVTSLSTCRLCDGEGSIISDPCQVCRGSGAVDRDLSVSVEIPAGVTSGTRLRLRGRGESAGRSGAPGDLFVEVAVAEDPRYERSNADLVHRVAVGIAEATLGTRISVPLIDGGEMDLEVPAGTQPGTMLAIPGQGMTVLGRRARGDLIVAVDVEVPRSLSPDQEEALRRWAEARGERIDRPAST